MNFEKLVNSKINEFADWIIRLVMVNIMIIVFSIPLLTIYPAVSAGFNMFHDYISGNNVKLFSGFFNYFKENLLRKVFIGIIIGMIIVMGFLNVRYYTKILEEDSSMFYLIGYYVTLALLAASYAASLYTFVVVKVSSKIKIKNVFKLSFVLAGKFYFRTLLLVIINSTVFVLLVYPPTAMIFIFMGISIVLVLDALVTRDVVSYLDGLGSKSD
jgi:uncharacterized membrane protein YesL